MRWGFWRLSESWPNPSICRCELLVCVYCLHNACALAYLGTDDKQHKQEVLIVFVKTCQSQQSDKPDRMGRSVTPPPATLPESGPTKDKNLPASFFLGGGGRDAVVGVRKLSSLKAGCSEEVEEANLCPWIWQALQPTRYHLIINSW